MLRVTNETEQAEVRRLVDATIAGFNRGDADAYVAMAHDESVQRMTGINAFVRGRDVRSMAPQIVDMIKRFTVDYEGTVVLGDTAVLWGTYVNVARGPEDADGDSTTGQFTITCGRVDGEWKAVCSHYSET